MKLRTALSSAACLLFLIHGAAAAVPSQPYRWGNVVIKGGGFVTGIVFHPREPNLAYARTDVGGAYRWNEADRHWIPLNDGVDQEDGLLLGVLSVGLDPNDPARVYLACGSYTNQWGHPAAVLISSDRGATWSRADLPFKLGGNENGRSTGERLQVDPRHPEVLLLGTNHDGLWRSVDRAKTWHRVSGFAAAGVTFVRFGRDGIYAGGVDPAAPALYRSQDDGLSWAPLPGQPRKLIAHHAAIDAAGTWYFALANGLGPNGVTDGAVWKFEPASNRWTDITPIRPSAEGEDVFGYAGVDVDPARAGTVVVSTLDRWRLRDEIFRTTDGGRTWQPLVATAQWDTDGTAYVAKMKPHWIGSVAMDPFDPRHAWFITGYGVWESKDIDAGDHGGHPRWVFADSGLEETVILDLASPSKGAELLSAIGDVDGFRHDDLSRSPANGAYQPTHGTDTTIAVAARQPSFVVRAHRGPTLGAVSHDGGTTWRDFLTMPPISPEARGGELASLAVAADGRRILWLPKGMGPFFSTDDGRTWASSRTSFVSPLEYSPSRPAADPVNPEAFYLYDHVAGRIFASTDGGVTFSVVGRVPERGGNLRAEPSRSGTLWLPAQTGLFVSSDAGHSFVRLPTVAEARQVGFGRAAPGRDRAVVFVAGKIEGRNGVFRSDDSGATWVEITARRSQFGFIRVLTGDPRIYGRVYLGTSGRGIIYGDSVR